MPPQAGATNMVQDFVTGKTAMIIDGPWDVSSILNDPGSVFKRRRGNLGIAGIPACPPDTRIPQAGITTGSPLGGQSYVISAGTGHPNEAYKFIRFMSLEKNQAMITKWNHTLQTRGSAYRDGIVFSDPVVKEFIPIMGKTARARPTIPQGAYFLERRSEHPGYPPRCAGPKLCSRYGCPGLGPTPSWLPPRQTSLSLAAAKQVSRRQVPGPSFRVYSPAACALS